VSAGKQETGDVFPSRSRRVVLRAQAEQSIKCLSGETDQRGKGGGMYEVVGSHQVDQTARALDRFRHAEWVKTTHFYRLEHIEVSVRWKTVQLFRGGLSIKEVLVAVAEGLAPIGDTELYGPRWRIGAADCLSHFTTTVITRWCSRVTVLSRPESAEGICDTQLDFGGVKISSEPIHIGK
jgi:hypothetical protein